ncbi:hypothetical protein Tco_0442594 [Tanacetum coccineum]
MPVRIISGHADIVQAAKLRKQADIQEGGEESILPTQEYIRKVVEDVGEDEDFGCKIGDGMEIENMGVFKLKLLERNKWIKNGYRVRRKQCPESNE